MVFKKRIYFIYFFADSFHGLCTRLQGISAREEWVDTSDDDGDQQLQ